ncbi:MULTISPECIES: hypothetical protein [Rahnella]|uniref:hypothetical protein n=1 Tax=Rahnella TaxID=34037 RepID=UPI003F6E15FE
MTDTTDTAALSREIVERLMDCGAADNEPVRAAYAFVYKILSAQQARLEAERQRAAGSEEELHKALHREKAAERKLLAAQEEIVALKSKLTNPVVLPAGYSARAGHPFHEGERNVMIPNKHGDWLSRFQVEHAIHVAGFHFTITGE